MILCGRLIWRGFSQKEPGSNPNEPGPETQTLKPCAMPARTAMIRFKLFARMFCARIPRRSGPAIHGRFKSFRANGGVGLHLLKDGQLSLEVGVECFDLFRLRQLHRQQVFPGGFQILR